ncbi:MAG: RNA-binding protein [Chloroflexi bacterium]|nr:RNA-binding protein [Chloroflexota bacterium]MCL5110810.1 RNA-binding protein [Chloroflexota bacterium]
MATRLYVGNLSYGTSADELRGLFAQAGTVEDVHMPTDRASGQPRGFAFVEMTSKEEADKAIQMFNGYTLGGRELRVNEAREREERGRSRY